MAARYSKFYRATHVAVDILLLNAAFFIGNSIHYNSILVSFTGHYLIQFLYMNLFWAVATAALKVYNIQHVVRFEQVLTVLFRAFFLHNLLIFAFIFIFREYVYSTTLYSVKYLLFVILICLWKAAFIAVVQFIRKRGLNYRRVVIVGTGAVGQQMYHFFRRHPEHGYRFLGFFSDNGNGDSQVIGRVEEVKKFALDHDVDEIFCALPDLDNDTVHDLIDFSEKNLVRFRLLPDFRGFDNRQVDISFYDTVPVLTVRKEPLENFSNRVVKRAFDIIFSFLVILLVFTWLVPLIAILIKISSKGPVFFHQLRSGRDNHPFMCYKFRSMRVNNLADELQATKNDPRITSIGKILRKTSLDELPQFYNVLIGNMSVVGPRPHMLKHTEEYSKLVDAFMVRHFVKPGITGLAQVSGLRGETTDPAFMRKRVEHDVWYLENWSLFLDIKIILLTIWTIIIGDKHAV